MHYAVVSAMYMSKKLCSTKILPTQPSIPPGWVTEYQLWLGRQRQVWINPLVDERGVCM